MLNVMTTMDALLILANNNIVLMLMLHIMEDNLTHGVILRSLLNQFGINLFQD